MSLGFLSPAMYHSDGWISRVRQARLPAALLAFSVAYFVAAKVGIATSLPPEGIVIVWPANAIVLFTLLSVDRSKWWIFFVATVLTEVVADVPDYPLWAATGYGIVNFSEAALVAVLFSRFSKNGLRLVRVNDFLVYVAVGPLLASGTAALFGAAIYKLGSPDLDYFHYWRVFWFGDAIGLLVVGTTLLAWKRPAMWPSSSRLHSVVEAVGLSLGFLAVTSWALLTGPGTPRVYTVFPLLLWAGFRFGVRGASAATLVLVAIAVAADIHGMGPFATLPTIQNVMALQGLIAVAALSTLVLAFTIEDSVRSSRRLVAANQHLEHMNRQMDKTVSDRTKHLSRAVAHNEMLLKEGHHRVKNNLQLVSSMLSLHARKIQDDDARSKLLEVQGQISSIGAIYQIIHELEEVEAVDFSQVVPILCRNIAGANGGRGSITPHMAGPCPVPADAAIALSLALNELATNSLKHSADREAVTVSVKCRRDGDRVVLRVADDGPGFPPGFDVDQSAGFGMRMVRAAVSQAGGDFCVVGTGQGAAIEVSVPVAAVPETDVR